MLFLGNELGNENDCLRNQIGSEVGNETAAILTLPGFASQPYCEVFIMAVNDKQSEQDWIARIKAGQGQVSRKEKPSLFRLEEILGTLRDLNVLALPSIPLQFKKHLPNSPAVYLCLWDDAVLYVGQSVDVHSRWANHDVCTKLAPYAESFTSPRLRVAWVECPKHLLDFVEIYLIGFFQPPLNIKHKG
jgi:hypothetical protein